MPDRRASKITNQERNELRQYLLGQLSLEAEEQVELRIMTDAGYAGRFDMIVDELTDDYVNEELSEEERRQAERHFIKSEDRLKKLRFTLALKDKKQEPREEERSARGPFMSTLPIAASVILAIGLAFGVWFTFFTRSQTDEGLLALQNAFRNRRPVESRISALGYAPYSETRGPGDNVTDVNELERSELELRNELRRKETPKTLHALGQVYLAKGEFDKAIELFEKALQTDPQNAKLHSDLGAAWLEKGKARIAAEPGKTQEDLGRSLQSLNRALELDGNLLEALFNRALCYQRLDLTAKAEEDWQAYLKKDPSSSWAEEARQYLKALQERKTSAAVNEKQLLENFQRAFKNNDDDGAWSALRPARSRAGNSVVNSLIDNYLELSINGNENEASEKLRMLSYAGDLEYARTSDHFTRDLARFYQSADASQLKVVQTARNLMKEAGVHYRVSQFDAAIPRYSEARRNFTAAGANSEALLAESWIGYSELRLLTTRKTVASFERLAREFATLQYSSLESQALHALADAKSSLNERSQTLALAKRAFKIAERIEDTPTMIRCLLSLLSAELSFGDYQASLDLFMRVKRLAETIPRDPRLMWTAYYEVGMVFQNLGLPAAAFAMEEEALRTAIEANAALLRSRSLERLALLYSAQKRYEEAIQTGERALAEADQVPGGRAKTSLHAHVMLRLGRYNLESGQAQKAIGYFNQSMDLYKDLKSDLYLYEAHKGKLMAHLQLNDNAAADTEVAIVLELFEHNRQKIVELSNRDKFFDVGQSTYDLATDFAFTRKHNFEEAFDYVERSRARSLLELISSGGNVVENAEKPELNIGAESQPLKPGEIKNRLPDNSQLVVYAVLDQKILIFVISKTSIEPEQVQIDQVELDKKIHSYVTDIQARSDPTGIEHRAKEFYKTLIAPIERHLNPNAIICIVADKSLNYLPFESLISNTRNRFFIEDYRIQRAPSATIFIRSSESAKTRSGKIDENLLIVGNPAFKSTEFNLPDLPDAAREAQVIGTFYPSKTRLIGEDATPAKVKRSLPMAHVIHLATHAVPDERSPLLSKFIMSPEKESERNSNHVNSSLIAFDIFKIKLPRAHLVVLSACRTGIERNYRGEGAIGLARPFIAAGVPLVIASLWPVDSRSTADLMISFHKYRKNPLPTVDALRQAKLDAIRNSQSDPQRSYDWAAFTAIGGYTAF